MDLNVLFAHHVQQLQQYYDDLGYAPQRLQSALQAAIDGEVERTRREVEDAQEKIDQLARQCKAYKDVLSVDGAEASSSGTGPKFHQGTFLARIEAWQAELGRLERQYMVRRAHVDRMIETLQSYRPILGDFVPVIQGAKGTPSALPSEADSSSCEIRIVAPIPNVHAVESALNACTEEMQRRNEQVDADAAEIAQLWAELALLPNNEDDEDTQILTHLRISPRLVDVGEGCLDFCGEFDEIRSDNDDEICDTPTRKSGSQQQLSGLSQRPNAILPTDELLTKIHEKRVTLEEERTRRTEVLQAVYDELVPLWRRFDVADEDVDAFVQANCGCTLAVIEAYESELKQMRELKSQHMALFISKVRQDIANLWDQLMMTPEERASSFQPFFYDLVDLNSDTGSGTDPTDELLALHEEKVQELSDDLESRARPLELVRQYVRLQEEEAQLEASAKDTTRLTGRGVPGQRRDPGRLLREEKMRKRLKFLKPKIEEEIMATIPAWEVASSRPFVINGQRFLDSIQIHAGSPKKRARTVSQQSQTIATPQMPSKRTNIDNQRAASASISSTAKRAQLPASSRPATATPATASQSKLRAPQPVSRPQSAAAKNHPSQQNGSASRIPSSISSNSSIALKTSTRPVLGDSSKINAASESAPQSKLASALHKTAKRTTPAQKRPSVLLEASLRGGPRPSSDFIKPSATGAGSIMRAANGFSKAEASMANDSLGPNWAVLDEDEENLLML